MGNNNKQQQQGRNQQNEFRDDDLQTDQNDRNINRQNVGTNQNQQRSGGGSQQMPGKQNR